MASVRRGPVSDAAGSSQLQQTHCGARLSPSAKIVVPQGKHVLEKSENHKIESGEGNK